MKICKTAEMNDVCEGDEQCVFTLELADLRKDMAELELERQKVAAERDAYRAYAERLAKALREALETLPGNTWTWQAEARAALTAWEASIFQVRPQDAGKGWVGMGQTICDARVIVGDS